MKFEKSRLEPIKLSLGGVDYPVRVTFNGMAELEEKFELSYTEVLDKCISQNLKAKEVQFILHVLLKGGGVEVTLDDLNKVDFTIDVFDALSDALIKANKVMSALEDTKDPENGGNDTEKKKKRA